MSPGLYMMTILILPVTAVIVFAMKYAAARAAARATRADGDDLRALIAGNADQLLAIGRTLRAIVDEQARQSRMLEGMDAMLREVG